MSSKVPSTVSTAIFKLEQGFGIEVCSHGLKLLVLRFSEQCRQKLNYFRGILLFSDSTKIIYRP